MEIDDKQHWYDGWFYDKFIAPNQDRAFGIVKSLMKENSVILDVGCGTGRLGFFLKGSYSKYYGVDPSVKNIIAAKNNLKKNPSGKIEFHKSDVKSFIAENNIRFDYSVISYVIHEIDEDKRCDVLNAIADVSENIIVVDYLHPRPIGYWTILNEAVEFIAGKDHYRNFKSFIKNGGIKGLAELSGLKIVTDIQNKPQTAHVVILKK